MNGGWDPAAVGSVRVVPVRVRTVGGRERAGGAGERD